MPSLVFVVHDDGDSDTDTKDVEEIPLSEGQGPTGGDGRGSKDVVMGMVEPTDNPAPTQV